MNKQDFVNAIAAKMPANTKKEALDYTEAFLEVIKEGLKEDGIVQFTGFGTFKSSDRPARNGRNPRTGEDIVIDAFTAISFKPGKLLKDYFNGKEEAKPAKKAVGKAVAKPAAKTAEKAEAPAKKVVAKKK